MEVAVTNPAQPAVSGSATMNGAYRTSRLVGDVLYTVTDQEVRSFRLNVAPFTIGASVTLDDDATLRTRLARSSISRAAMPVTAPPSDCSTFRSAGGIVPRGKVDLPGLCGGRPESQFRRRCAAGRDPRLDRLRSVQTLHRGRHQSGFAGIAGNARTRPGRATLRHPVYGGSRLSRDVRTGRSALGHRPH